MIRFRCRCGLEYWKPAAWSVWRCPCGHTWTEEKAKAQHFPMDKWVDLGENYADFSRGTSRVDTAAAPLTKAPIKEVAVADSAQYPTSAGGAK